MRSPITRYRLEWKLDGDIERSDNIRVEDAEFFPKLAQIFKGKVLDIEYLRVERKHRMD